MHNRESSLQTRHVRHNVTRGFVSVIRQVSVAVVIVMLEACAQKSPGPTAKEAIPHRFPVQVIVKVAHTIGDPSSPAFIKELRAASGCSIEYVREMAGNLHLFRLPAAQGEDAVACIKGLSKSKDVEFAELDAIQKAF
jgi:hypothetical protein